MADLVVSRSYAVAPSFLEKVQSSVLYFRVSDAVFSRWGVGLVALSVGVGACYGAPAALCVSALALSLLYALKKPDPARLLQAVKQQNLEVASYIFDAHRTSFDSLMGAPERKNSYLLEAFEEAVRSAQWGMLRMFIEKCPASHVVKCARLMWNRSIFQKNILNATRMLLQELLWDYFTAAEAPCEDLLLSVMSNSCGGGLRFKQKLLADEAFIQKIKEKNRSEALLPHLEETSLQSALKNSADDETALELLKALSGERMGHDLMRFAWRTLDREKYPKAVAYAADFVPALHSIEGLFVPNSNIDERRTVLKIAFIQMSKNGHLTAQCLSHFWRFTVSQSSGADFRYLASDSVTHELLAHWKNLPEKNMELIEAAGTQALGNKCIVMFLPLLKTFPEISANKLLDYVTFAAQEEHLEHVIDSIGRSNQITAAHLPKLRTTLLVAGVNDTALTCILHIICRLEAPPFKNTLQFILDNKLDQNFGPRSKAMYESMRLSTNLDSKGSA